MGGRIVLHRHHDAPGVHFQRTRTIEILTPGLDVQADGEYFGETPMSFSVQPGALRVLLPAGGARKIVDRSLQAGDTVPDSTR
jgi:diacylglycerol kinase family enzyme